MNDPEDKYTAAVSFLRESVPGLLAIYRFGSAGTVYQRPNSDLDLAFLAERPLANLRRWELEQDLATRLGRDLDLIDLGRASTVLRLQVAAYGDRLYCADVGTVDQFEDLTYSLYARLNEERRGILEDIRSRGNIYGQ